MVADELKDILTFINDSKQSDVSEAFTRSTKHAESAWTHLYNIEIACDLTDNESLNWKTFES
jgi:hypothetical protein